MPTFGSVAGVGAYVRHMAFDTPNNPTTTDVTAWLTARSSQLVGWLAAAGFVVPDWTVYPNAKAVLDNYANLGAACLAELSQRSSGYDAGDENKRENKFCAQFAEAEDWIGGPALAALGVPQTLIGSLAAEQPSIGQIVAGGPTDTTRILPPEWRV